MKEYISKEEVLQVIHDIYSNDLYCMNDYCESEEKGTNCDDCLYCYIRKNIENIKGFGK